MGFDTQLAERKFAFDKEFAVFKSTHEFAIAEKRRKVDFAEKMLADFYRCRDIFYDARAPFVAAQEMVADEGENEELVRDANYAPVRRLMRDREFFSGFAAREYQNATLFGPEVRQAYRLIGQVNLEIRLAVDHLISIKRNNWPAPNWNDADDPRRKAFRVPIGNKDEIGEMLDEAFRIIEDAVRPYLEQEKNVIPAPK